MTTRTSAIIAIILACRATSAADPAGTEVDEAATFYACAGVAPADLPADAVYPRGRRFPYMGYSGDPARDLAAGFTVAGPVYGDQRPYLERCVANGWPVVAHVGLPVTFHDKAPDKYRIDEPALREAIAGQVRDLAPHAEIAWWIVRPEELRPWRGDEMRYLAIVAETVREHDPLGRPITLYNPNHRDAGSLVPIAKHVDIVAKGCYVNLTGHARDRAWVRWSVEQELAAIARAGRSNAFAIVMPELCRDPAPAEDAEIERWVRHDVYLGLASGAKGVLIWSLFPRRDVKRTWKLWHDAYARCGRELGGERGLGAVFLFGERRHDLRIGPVRGAGTIALPLGGDAEPETTTEAERAPRTVQHAAWTATEIAHGTSRFVFVINSANDPAAFTVAGWPAGSAAVDAFTGEPVALPAASHLRLDLPAYGVAGIRLQPAAGLGPAGD